MILSSPLPEKKLFMYLAVLDVAISAILFRKKLPISAKTNILYQSNTPRCGDPMQYCKNIIGSSMCQKKATPLF